jgi:hypothetical protein
MAKISDRQHTAIHEAGHAVIGRVMSGMPCGKVTIKPDFEKQDAGNTITVTPYEMLRYWEKHGIYRWPRSAICARIMTYMAGAEAENVILGRCHGGDTDDRNQIGEIADEYFAPEHFRHRHEPRMRRQTRRLVRHHRDKIERPKARSTRASYCSRRRGTVVSRSPSPTTRRCAPPA